MSSMFLTPLKVLGLGILVSYGVAVLMRVTIRVIRHFEKVQADMKEKRYLRKNQNNS